MKEDVFPCECDPVSLGASMNQRDSLKVGKHADLFLSRVPGMRLFSMHRKREIFFLTPVSFCGSAFSVWSGKGHKIFRDMLQTIIAGVR